MVLKPRIPGSIPDAVTIIMAALGDDECAKSVGKSAALIRKWADPDHEAKPNVMQAITLDIAYVAAGHGNPPLLEAYSRKVKAGDGTQAAVATDPQEHVLNIMTEVGELAADVAAARADKKITAGERAKIVKDLRDVRKKIDAAIDDLSRAVRS